jgi:hypothetical protein
LGSACAFLGLVVMAARLASHIRTVRSVGGA